MTEPETDHDADPPASIAVLARRALRVPDAPGSAGKVVPQVDATVDEPAGAQSAPDVVKSRRGPRLGTLLCALAAAGALVFAVVSGVVWMRDVYGGAAKVAVARDAALTQARIDIATLNTIDYTQAAAGLQRWSTVTTGALHDQITANLTKAAQTISGTKTSTTAVVLAAAVTSLDVNHGTATVIASVQVTKTPDAGQAVVDRNRVKATMIRVGGSWRLSDLSAVAVQLS